MGRKALAGLFLGRNRHLKSECNDLSIVAVGDHNKVNKFEHKPVPHRTAASLPQGGSVLAPLLRRPILLVKTDTDISEVMM